MPDLLIVGMGYTAGRLAARLRAEGWRVTGVRRSAGPDVLAFDDDAGVRAAIGRASHILSSVPPDAEGDTVLVRYGADIAAAPAIWTGYLSSTGVYGDVAGAWVDEGSAVGGGRRGARVDADRDWGAIRPDMRRFRLPGIYGPGRSALDRVREGRAHRIAMPGQVFSRVHVDDIVTGVIASFGGPPGIYNLADDAPCSQNRVIEAACDLLGLPWPPIQTMDEARLSPMARGFYAENRRIANGRAKRVLGWTLRYPSFETGLRACR